MAKTLTVKALKEALEVAEYYYIKKLEGEKNAIPAEYVGKTKFLVFREKKSWTLCKEVCGEPPKEIASVSICNAYHEDVARVLMSIIKML